MRGARIALGVAGLVVLGTLAACGGTVLLRPPTGPGPAVLPGIEVPPYEARLPLPPAAAPTAEVARKAEPARSAAVAAARRRLARHIVRAYRVGPRDASQIVDDAYRQAAARHLRPTLLLAVIAQESSFRSDAVSAIGAVGLMQIRPELHDWRRDRLGLTGALTDPAINIAIGADVLRECLQRHRGDLGQALSEYSGGASDYPLKVARLELDFVRLADG
jgi:soluble lytic murein transglycosylase-like protein